MTKKIPNYLVFGFSKFHPLGGWNDLTKGYSTLEEAKEAARALVKAAYNTEYVTVQVVDLQTGNVIFDGRP